jgi:two-component system phosphate regulon sensor histidine kinase PhoR
LLRHEHRLPFTERRAFLEAIGQASDRLEAVIEQLLEMSELEAGAVRLERFPIDVERLVEDAVLAAWQRSESRAPGKYVFTIARPSAADESAVSPPLVRGDARHLRIVIDQVLGNAVKYSPNGGTIGVAIRIPATPHPDEDEAPAPERQDQRTPLVEIEVRDPGVGIPTEQLRQVFERFHRIDNGLARETEGMGLGLAIARHIVELHGGTIRAESSPGEGSAFRVLLPLDGEPETDLGRERRAGGDNRPLAGYGAGATARVRASSRSAATL